jgi:hypothetical protein
MYPDCILTFSLWNLQSQDYEICKNNFSQYIDLSSITVLPTVECECPVFFIFIMFCDVRYFYFKHQPVCNCLIKINSGTAHGNVHICYEQCSNGIRCHDYSFRLVFLWIIFLQCSYILAVYSLILLHILCC